MDVLPRTTIADQAVWDTPVDMARHGTTMRHAKRVAAAGDLAIEPVTAAVATSQAASEPVSAGVIGPAAAERLSPAALNRATVPGTDGRCRTMLTHRVPF